MSKCSVLAMRVGSLAGAIIILEEHRTLYPITTYERVLETLEQELAAAEKAYLACLKG